jgi:hypothetical protein
MVERVQFGQRVDQRLGDGAPRARVEGGRGRASAQDDAVDPLHEIEGHSEHGRVFAVRERARRLRIDGGQGGQDPMLAPHVVRALDGGPARRPAQHGLAPSLDDEVREVRETPRELLDRERARELGQGLGEEGVQRLRVDLLAAADRARLVDEGGVVAAVPHQISTSTP